MLKDMGYGRQMDGFSCGFCVISFVRSFAVGRKFIPEVGYVQYSRDVTEIIRSGCISTYINAILELRWVEDFDKGLRDS